MTQAHVFVTLYGMRLVRHTYTHTHTHIPYSGIDGVSTVKWKDYLRSNCEKTPLVCVTTSCASSMCFVNLLFNSESYVVLDNVFLLSL